MANEPKPEPAADPNPSPESAPPPSAAASSPASERGSESEAGGFVADAGPAFDPETAINADVPPIPPADRAVELLEEWEEEAICGLLGIKGRLLHAAIGVAEEDWFYTELDLMAIGPPLTRICNRYEPVRRYAKYGDPVTVVTAIAAYATRSLLERREVLAAFAEEADTQPIPPADAPPPIPPPQAPRPAPRPAATAANVPPGPPPPMQPSQGPAAPRDPRPGEAPIDPTKTEWAVEG